MTSLFLSPSLNGHWFFLVLEAAEVLKIGFSPDKLLAHTKYVKICDLFFGKCGETVLYFVIPDICRERETGHG